MNPADKLAATLVEFDADNTGPPDGAVEVPAETWAEWIDLAGQIQAENDQ